MGLVGFGQANEEPIWHSEGECGTGYGCDLEERGGPTR